MDTDTTTETMKEHAAMESEGSPAHTTLRKGAGTNGSVEQTVNDTIDTAAQKVGETYEKAKSFSNENPGKAIFIALGIGVGLGLLLNAGSARSTTSRIAEPIVNALADIAKEFIR